MTESEMRELVKALAIFSDTFNERPINHPNKIPRLYYSEKLITKTQLQDYERAVKRFFDYLEGNTEKTESNL